MAVEEYLARDFKFSASPDGNTWTPVGGVTSWGWIEDGTEVEVTDFDDGGWTNNLLAQVSGGLNLEVNSLVDPASGAPDPGQKILDSAARKPGVTGYAYIKVEPRDAALDGSIEGKVIVKRGEKGGGNADRLGHSYELMFKGKPTLTGMFDPDAVISP